MKYARFVNTGTSDYLKRVCMVNIGDNIKSISVKQLLHYANIRDNDILEVSYYDQSSISEPCCLILNNHYRRNGSMNYMYNSNIRPVFIGWGLAQSDLLPEEINYIKQYEPILCRDEFTKIILTKYQIEAYVIGCLSLTFDRRESTEGNNGKYYFVGIKEKFMENVPEYIKNEAVVTTQHIKMDYIDEQVMKEEEINAKRLLSEYKQSAKMVISSLLHCICPCIAMGIPTIAVSDNFSYKYSFLDAFITSYDRESFSKYDWRKSENSVEMESIKKLILKAGCSVLEGSPDYDSIKKLDKFYTNREKWNYCSSMKDEIKRIFKEDSCPQFIIWGASVGGHTVYCCIKELYPQSEMKAIVDRYEEGVWSGKKIEKPEDVIAANPNVVVIVATMSGESDAESLMSKMGRQKMKDYFFIHESR